MRNHQLLGLLAFVTSASATCYNPNGKQATWPPNMRECNAGTDFTSCCGEKDECYTNGLCKGEGDGSINWFYRYGCTDSSWDSPSCPQYCKGSDWWRVYQCTETTFCCADAGEALNVTNNFSCCDSPDQLFTAQAPQHLAGPKVYIASIWTANTATPPQTSAAPSPPPAASSAVEPDEPQTSTAESQPTSIAGDRDAQSSQAASSGTSGAESGPQSTLASGVLAAASNTLALPTTAPSLPSSTSNSATAPAQSQDSGPAPTPIAVKIGLGVGVGFGAALIGLLGFFIWRQKQVRARNNAGARLNMADNAPQNGGEAHNANQGEVMVVANGQTAAPQYTAAKMYPHTHVQELGNERAVYEMSAERTYFEMGQKK